MRSPDLAPDILPVLSQGKHRSPRQGACFMEFASYLAGERWSDHPKCVHPVLGALARNVNDCTGDSGRSRLAPLIPSAVGLNPDGVRPDALIVLRCAQIALPVVSMDRAHVMAVALFAAERIISELDGRPLDHISSRTKAALDQTPEAADWARRFAKEVDAGKHGTVRRSPKFRREVALNMVRYAVPAVRDACVADTENLMFQMLAGSIEDLHALSAAPVVGLPAEMSLTG